jgi:hypothetical protein
MPPLKRDNPEAVIQKAIIKELRYREWDVMETHGNEFQKGFPDLWCMHRIYGGRWVEVKNPLAYSFTSAQKTWFPRFESNGIGIWILVSANPSEIQKLWTEKANWRTYFRAANGLR